MKLWKLIAILGTAAGLLLTTGAANAVLLSYEDDDVDFSQQYVVEITVVLLPSVRQHLLYLQHQRPRQLQEHQRRIFSSQFQYFDESSLVETDKQLHLFSLPVLFVELRAVEQILLRVVRRDHSFRRDRRIDEVVDDDDHYYYYFF